MIAPDDIKTVKQAELPGTNGLTLDEFERRLIQATLNENSGNRTRTAQQLGVSLRWLQYRLKEWSNE
jgi:Nif-specific regulatory protein